MSHQENNSRSWRQLQYPERIKIEAYYSEGHTAPKIAKILGRHRTTIEREIKLGLVEIDQMTERINNYPRKIFGGVKGQDERASRTLDTRQI